MEGGKGKEENEAAGDVLWLGGVQHRRAVSVVQEASRWLERYVAAVLQTRHAVVQCEVCDSDSDGSESKSIVTVSVVRGSGDGISGGVA